MPDHDTAPATPGDILTALALLTRLPVRADLNRGAAAAWAYPLAGLAVGGLAAFAAALGTGLPPGLTAGVALLAMILVTGALHEDGLADSADGLWGGWTRDRRLEIMKDSHIGTYGVLALILSLGLRWTALTAIANQGGLTTALLAAALLSRVPMVALMHFLPNARGSGLSSQVGRPRLDTVLIALGIAAGSGLLLLGVNALPLALLLLLITLGIIALAKVKLGGQTGDILGASQQVAEITILAYLAA